MKALKKLKTRNFLPCGINEKDSTTHSGVEAQVTDVTGNDGFLLGRWSHAKGVVDHGLLHWVHLRTQMHIRRGIKYRDLCNIIREK